MPVINIKVDASTANAVNGLLKVQKTIESAGNAALAFGIDIAGRVMNGLMSIPRAFENAISAGVRFNAVLEDARLGIAAVIKQFNPGQFDDFNDALKAADQALGELQKKAIESPATFQSLVAAFQAVSGPMASANIGLKQQVELIVSMSQALSGLGIHESQIVQEIRALVTGNINADAAAAKTLNITAQDIARAKEAGRLYEFLSERIAAFAEAGRHGANNFSVSLSSVKDAYDAAAASFAKPIFDALKRSFVGLAETLKNPEFVESLRGIAEKLTLITAATAGLAQLGVDNIGKLASVFEGLVIAIGAASVAFAALKSKALLTSPLTLYGAAFSGVVKIIEAGVQAWRSWKAGQQEAMSVASLETQNRERISALREEIRALEQVGELSAARARGLRTMLSSAISSNLNGFAGSASEMLNEVTRGLRQSPRERFNIEIPTPAVKPVNAEEHRNARLAELEREEADVKNSFQHRVITEAEYFRKRADFIRARTNIEFEATSKSQEVIRALEAKEDAALLALAEERLQEADRVARETAAAEIEIAEQKGEKLLAAELRIKQQFSQLRSSQPQLAANIELAEKHALAQARIADDIQRQSTAQAEFQQKVQTTNALLETGQISRKEAQQRNNEAAQEYLKVLRQSLDVLLVIAQVTPGAEGLAEAIATVRAEMEQTEATITRGGFIGQMERNIKQLNQAWSDFGANVANVLTNGVQSAVHGVTNSIMDAMAGVQSWGQTFTQVGRQIIASLIQITLEYGASKLAMMAVDAVFHKKSQQQAAQTTATSGAAGVAKAGEQGGWAGVLIYLGVFAAAIAAVSAVAAGLTGGFKVGGYTGDGDPNQVAGPVHKEEYVMNREHRWIFPLLEKVRKGAIGARDIHVGVRSGMARPITGSPEAMAALPGLSGAAAAQAAPPVVNVAPAPVQVVLVDDEQRAIRAIESHGGQSAIARVAEKVVQQYVV